ncbi:hypothetical protein TNCV_2464571 [Trichonephila clavipes]|nr:hypothetical protein TNCV_2464571 [Trichonephila clavipes]
MTTECLKTYNVHRAIGVRQARDQMGRDRHWLPKNKRSKKEVGGERREVYKESKGVRTETGFERTVLEAPPARELIRNCYTRAFGDRPRILNHDQVTWTTPELAHPSRMV